MTSQRWLPSLLATIVCCSLSAFSQENPPIQRQSIPEQYLLAAANAGRLAHNLPQLQLDARLSNAALGHVREMAAHTGISHQFSGEPDLAERAALAGARFSLVTENVAEASNPAIIHDLWMRSAGHRANLLDPQVNQIGIAVTERNGQFYAVEDFARAVASLTLDQQESLVGTLVARTGIAVVPATTDARKTCSMPTGYAGPRKPWFTMRYTAADLAQLPTELTERLASGKYRQAIVAACEMSHQGSDATPFSGYAIAVLLYP